MPERLKKGKKRKVTKSFSMEECLYNAYATLSYNEGLSISTDVRKSFILRVRKAILNGKYKIPSDVEEYKEYADLLRIVGLDNVKK